MSRRTLERILFQDDVTLPRDQYGAFCVHADVTVSGRGQGPLAGLRFAAKDLFDLEGFTACCGNPDWLRTHEPARTTAPAIRMLLDAGASLNGMTIMDELAFSLTGENVHYGTPINPRAQNRMPGGSSSGSAVAVASGLADFALGSDTGGSVRVPASYCGLYGIRPTHGRIASAGMMPHVPSADTVGWFARDATMLARVGAAMLGGPESADGPTPLLIADDAFAAVRDDIRPVAERAVESLANNFASVRHVTLSPDSLGAWADVYATIQNYSVWQLRRDWVERTHPRLSDPIRERLAIASQVTRVEFDAALRDRERIRARIDALLAGRAILCMPTTPIVALPRSDPSVANSFRKAHLELTCVAGLSGTPQLSLPLAEADGCPFGISILTGRGRDELLLVVAQRISSNGSDR